MTATYHAWSCPGTMRCWAASDALVRTVHLIPILSARAGLPASWSHPGESLLMVNIVYVCPVACHRDITERLLLTNPDGSWFLWMGDQVTSELIRVPASLARWIGKRPEMTALDHPVMWFEVASLPVTPVSAGPGRSGGTAMS